MKRFIIGVGSFFVPYSGNFLVLMLHEEESNKDSRQVRSEMVVGHHVKLENFLLGTFRYETKIEREEGSEGGKKGKVRGERRKGRKNKINNELELPGAVSCLHLLGKDLISNHGGYPYVIAERIPVRCY